MQTLQTLLDLLTAGRRLHISILDVTGVLNTASTAISFANVIHSKDFCALAKSTARGQRLCMYCKRCANKRAVEGKAPFLGLCAYGVLEAAVPVQLGDTTAAVVYVGNAVSDRGAAEARLKKACRRTGVSEQALLAALSGCEAVSDGGELLQIGEVVADYIKMLAAAAPTAQKELHWLAVMMKRHADMTYLEGPTLKELAALYHKNEKYMGRLFLREMGMSFHRYCLLLRLQRAKALLLQSEHKVIDIALQCGFDNISYFNRAFKEEYGASPTAYRRGGDTQREGRSLPHKG